MKKKIGSAEKRERMGYFPFLVLYHDKEFYPSIVIEKSLSRQRFLAVGCDRKFLIVIASGGLRARPHACMAPARAQQMHYVHDSAHDRHTTHVAAFTNGPNVRLSMRA